MSLSPLTLCVAACLFLTAPASANAPRTDRHGAPLPPGAVARLGTIRLGDGHGVAQVEFSHDERVGNDDARRLLASLASGAPSARLTQPARAALRRVGRWDEMATEE